MRFTLTSQQAPIGAINVLANMTFSRTDPFKKHDLLMDRPLSGLIQYAATNPYREANS